MPSRSSLARLCSLTVPSPSDPHMFGPSLNRPPALSQMQSRLKTPATPALAATLTWFNNVFDPLKWMAPVAERTELPT